MSAPKDQRPNPKHPNSTSGPSICCGECQRSYHEGRIICWHCLSNNLNNNQLISTSFVLPGRGKVLITFLLLFLVLSLSFVVGWAIVDEPGTLKFYVAMTLFWAVPVSAWLITWRIHPVTNVLRAIRISLVAFAAFFFLIYLIGGSAVGWGWPVDAWVDLRAKDFVYIDIVRNKRTWTETNCSAYGCTSWQEYRISVGAWEWKVSQNTYSALAIGEPVEIAYKPLTKIMVYLTYGIAEDIPADSLRVAVSLAKEERRVFEEALLPEWEKQTGIKVEFVQINPDLLVDVLRHPVGRPFDLLAVDNNVLVPLVEKELVQDLTEQKHLIPDTALSSLLPLSQFGGRTYFLPFRPNVRIIYYNERLFENSGLSPPTTWDELMHVARDLKARDSQDTGRVALAGYQGANRAVEITELIWQAGGDPLVLDDDGSVRAFAFLQEIYQYLSPNTFNARFDTMNEYLITDNIYLGPNWSFGVDAVILDAGKTEVKVYPGWSGPHGMAHVLGGDMLAIPHNAPDRDRALAFAEFLLSREVQSILATELFWPPMRSDALDAVSPELAPYWDAINTALIDAQPRPPVRYWNEVERILNDAWLDVVLKGKDVTRTLDHYAKEVRELQ